MAVRKAEVLLNGVAASPGIAMGNALVLARTEIRVPKSRLSPDEIEPEVGRLLRAIETTKHQLVETRTKVAQEMGESYARIFDAHRMILEDKLSTDEIVAGIRAGSNAEFAVNTVLSKHERLLWEKGDVYIKDRAADIRDVRIRVLSNLSGTSKGTNDLSNLGSDVIVVAHDLSPAETAQLRKESIRAFATDVGGRTSHTVIMARSLEIPAVVGLHNALGRVQDDDFLIVDGNRGRVVVQPSPETMEKYKRELQHYASLTKGLLRFRDLPAVTVDGHSIMLSANIESHEEADSVVEHGAQGIGLYRTEFMFVGREGLPAEDEQYRVYDAVASKVSPHPVIIRTMDIGGDKFLSDFESPKEMNPYLGWRGIRFGLARRDIFKTQLRAILRASTRGNIKIMYPMVSNLDEISEARAVLEETMAELDREGKGFDRQCEVGIMMETPAAVMIAPELARHVDFFSIGSNDLIQYALAADRGNDQVAYLYEPLHLGVLRFIKQTVTAAKEAGIWVGLCGEMSSDPVSALVLLGLDLDELSTSPYAVPEIKEMVRSVSYADARKLAEEALTIERPEEIRKRAMEIIGRESPELPL
ncbi:MAG TPA: phosphoenolpyruvate--protein phosphotransferase [bacterium]|nr:phosphoenolpyruvate--protein phosphotransferase [bacterium]